MVKITGKQFQIYAGRNLLRWKELTGRIFIHDSWGLGIFGEISTGEQDLDISVLLDNNEVRHCAPDMLQHVNEINFSTLDALRILKAIADRAEALGASDPVPSPPEQEPPNTPAQPPLEDDSPPRKFDIQDKVRLKFNPTQHGIIIGIALTNRQWLYTVFFTQDDTRIVVEKDLELLIPETVWCPLDDFLRDLALIKLRRPMSDALYALNGSRTEFAVYQYKPALKFLANPDQRILIADEVGLGKTIEAGIIFLELQARVDLPRVLIVCPSSLKQKWQDEMKSRFDEEFDILDRHGLERFFNNYAREGEYSRLRGIVSLELIRLKQFAEKFTSINLDLLIIDEAHHCRNTATLANALAQTLAENSDAALLLTATPLQMGRSDLFNLLNILSPGEFDNFDVFENRLQPNQFINRASQLLAQKRTADALKELRNVESTSERNRFKGNPFYDEVISILNKQDPGRQELVRAQRRLLELNTLASVFTRTRKRDILEKPAMRTAQLLKVRLTSAEQQFYEQVIEEVREEYEGRHGSGAGSGWITVMKERQVASCISAAIKRWKEEHPDYEIEEETFKEEFVAPELDEEPAPKEVRLSAKSLREEEANQELIRSLFDEPAPIESVSSKLPNIQVDSKFEIFWQALEEVLAENSTSKIIIFAYFRDTIEHIQEQLRKRGVDSKAIHGGYKVSDRNQIIEEFRENPGCRVLISSDVGSEGLDFQFCDTIFNYDLPWNPMRVEQRIGRIDRFGQKSERIRIYNLVLEDTIESRILYRLYERIQIFERSIGDIEVILGDQVRSLREAIFSSRLSPEEEQARAEESFKTIEWLKQVMEEFEGEMMQFLGQEAIFASAVEQTQEAGRFISGKEVRALVEGYLRSKAKLSSLEQNVRDEETFALKVNNDLYDDLQYLHFTKKVIITGNEDFFRKLRPGTELPVTFSRDLAHARKLLEFITPRHPLAQAAVFHFKQTVGDQKRIAKFKINSDEIAPGIYHAFVYVFDTEGVEKDSRLMPVVIREQTRVMDEGFSAAFLGLVQKFSHPSDALYGDCESPAFLSDEEASMIYATTEREALEEELKKNNQAIIKSRLEALKQSYQAKKRHIESIRMKVTNESILKMYEGQLRKMKDHYDNKVREIESRNQVGVTMNLFLRACVEVVNNY